MKDKVLREALRRGGIISSEEFPSTQYTSWHLIEDVCKVSATKLNALADFLQLEWKCSGAHWEKKKKK